MDFLPESFKDKMRELLGSDFDSFLRVYNEKHNAGIRVNNLKLSADTFGSVSPVPVSPVRWVPNGFYYDESEQPAKHPYYYAGMFYIQEPSAMTPASLLPVKPGDRVLDICAAPGGKSTELGSRLYGEGVLVSNDISNSRAKALLKNVELFGIRNAVVISEAPAKLTPVFEEYFDRILVDAPCSGEGMFRKSHAIIKNWEQYGTGYYAKLQREILPEAIRMLKPGGYMIYSTCTFSSEEDEGTLNFILDNFKEMEVVPAIADGDPRFEGFVRAYPRFASENKSVENALRIYPHKVKGEGHFVALLHKKAWGQEEPSKTEIVTEEAWSGKQREKYFEKFTNSYSETERKSHKDISGEAFDFFERLGFEIPADRLMVREERVYMLPNDLPLLKGLRVMRSGLLLGEMKKGRFEPSEALACAIAPGQYDNVYSLAADDMDVIRYLKCETIDVPDTVSDGYVLVCVDGYPLGWGKVAGGRFKNKYLPGWRMM